MKTPLGLRAVRLDNQEHSSDVSSNRPARNDSARVRLVLDSLASNVAKAVEGEELISGDERFRIIVQHAAVGIGLVSPEGVILHANPRLSAMLGFSAEELAGMSIADITHPDDVATDMDKFAELVAGVRSAYAMDKRYHCKDGSLLWGRLSTSLVRKPDGSIEYILGMVEDITELRRLNHDVGERVKELNAMRALSKRLLRAADGDLPTLLQDVANLLPPAFQFSEITVAKVRLGEHTASCGTLDSHYETLRTEWRGANDCAGCIEIQYTGYAPPASEGPFLAEERALIDSIADLLQVASAGLREAAERSAAERALKSSEAQLQIALQAAHMGTIDWDLSVQVAHISEVTRQIFDFPEGTTSVSVPEIRARIHPDFREAVQRAVREEIEGAASKDMEYRLQLPNGVSRWVVVRARVFYNDDGAPVRRVGVIVDVTGRHQLEEQLRHAQKMEAVGRLAGGVAHDFNNLLTVISAAADFVYFETKPDTQMRQDVQDILNTVKRAHKLTSQLLTFSRRQVVRPTQLDLNELVRGTDSMLRRLLGADVTLKLSLSQDDVRVHADAGQLEQVVMNLVVNARDAIVGSGMISLGTGRAIVDEELAKIRPELAPGDYAVLTITDSGVGMDDATLERIFEPFFTTKEANKGTGLGLATVFGIVKQAGGHIFVYSELGLGTTFRIYLPFTDAGITARDRTRSGSSPTVGGSETILLVEDELNMRLFATRILTDSGYEVIEASNGNEALIASALHQGPIHLLLSDVVMPGINGPDLADRLQQSRPDMKMMFMSGYTSDALLHHRLTTSDTPFLEKPFSRTDLAAAVRGALDCAITS